MRVPDGIDPGWAYNPGRAGYEARVNQAIAEKIADAPPELVDAAVQERVGEQRRSPGSSEIRKAACRSACHCT